MPKVSVIIPVYGVQEYIERSAKSLFEQSLDDIEFLFINDCTTDRSVEILQQVVEEYPNRKGQVIIHQMEHNSGQAAVRKWGALNAAGEYIFHCDSDDWIDKKLLETMYNKAQEKESDVVICDLYCTGECEDKIISGGRCKKRDDCISEMMHRNMQWSLCNKMFKKDLYNSIVFPDGDMGEDMCMCFQLMYNSQRIDYIKELYYYYNIHTGSIVTSVSKEKILSKYSQLSSNIRIIQDFFSDKLEDLRWVKGLKYLNHYQYEMLQPLLYDNEIKQIWQDGIRKTSLSVVFK